MKKPSGSMFRPGAPASRPALECYTERYQEAMDLLERVKVALDEHAPPDHLVTWPHAGDLGYVTASLRDIANFLRGEGEYAS